MSIHTLAARCFLCIVWGAMPCYGTNVLNPSQNVPITENVFANRADVSTDGGTGPVNTQTVNTDPKTVEQDQSQQEKAKALQSGIEDLINRLPQKSEIMVRKAYQEGTQKCADPDRVEFFSEVLAALRWWKDVSDLYKEKVKEQTKEHIKEKTEKKPKDKQDSKKSVVKDGQKVKKESENKQKDDLKNGVDIDRAMMNKIASGKYKKVKAVLETLSKMIQTVKSGKKIQKIDSSKKKNKSLDGSLDNSSDYTSDDSILEEYGYDADTEAGDEYSEGDSLSEELDLEYSLEEEADGFRVHKTFEQEGDSIINTPNEKSGSSGSSRISDDDSDQYSTDSDVDMDDD